MLDKLDGRVPETDEVAEEERYHPLDHHHHSNHNHHHNNHNIHTFLLLVICNFCSCKLGKKLIITKHCLGVLTLFKSFWLWEDVHLRLLELLACHPQKPGSHQQTPYPLTRSVDLVKEQEVC